ncbi:CoA ester lyase [Pseudomonas aeruginosa]|uniref:HpcH/HpaI aldolase/citrate lyase family protein n=1 Tax=Pseudomonas aeruginosa TaxID=287 RepID=UPI000EB50D15|nr:CoA ester lyase [Pseudomonas aeruginosa]RTV63347.1 CoA ester lyase [Pseudomonas aeruginosa]
MKPHRSYLFVPGDRPERFDKACATDADVVILDLEDAVPPENKDSARRMVAEWLALPRSVPIMVRLNGVDTEWLDEDLAALRQAQLVGVMIPKVSGPEDVDYVAQRLEQVPVIALIETAEGLMRAYDIARHERVLRLAFGSIDFQVETGIQGDREALLFSRSQLVIHSRAAGVLPPIDGVCTSTNDAALVLEECRYARALGFAAKLCIHPSQIAAVHQGFAPSVEELEWAQGVLEAVRAAGTGAIRYQGKMIDLPVIERARQIVEQANR